MSELINIKANMFLNYPDRVEATLDFYESKMKSKEIFTKQFSMADEEGNLIVYEDAIRVQLDNLDINGKMYQPKYRANALAGTYHVVVTSVDRKKNVVHVSQNEAKALTKEELDNDLNKAIENNAPMVVLARVTKIRGKAGSSYAVINIGDVGITGVIKMGDWSSVFTSDLHLVTKSGDIIKVAVKKKIFWDGKPGYSCSRGDALGFNPWSGIEEKLPEGTLVNVTCIDKRTKNFFGMIDGIAEINAYCEYPNPDKNIEIENGEKYQGKVYRVSEEKKLLRVRIFKKL